MSKKQKGKVATLLLCLQVIFSLFIPLQPLANIALAQEDSSVNFTKNGSTVKVSDSEADDYQYFFKSKDDTIQASAGATTNGNFDLNLKSQSGEDVVNFDIDRLVLKTNLNSYYLEIADSGINRAKEYSSSSLSLSVEDKNFLLNSWQIDNALHIATTMDKVVLNQEYSFPFNEEVKVTFTKLPENPGSLTIQKIELTDEQMKTVGGYNNIAFDITSNMENGTFEYDLKLPLPEGADKNSQLVYANSVDELFNAKAVENEVVADDEMTAEGLNHFTVFVVSSPAPPSDISGIVDNGDSEYSDDGTWKNTSSCAANAYDNDGRYAANSGTNTATWSFSVPASGDYNVYFSWIKYSNQATNAQYTINYEGGSDTKIIDQHGTNCEWSNFVSQGTYNFQTGNTYSVVLSNDGADGNVFADAIKIESTASPNEVWVDDDWSAEALGTDFGGGKVVGYTAFSTIQEGIDQVADGGTVNVAAGTYIENVEIDTPNITLQSNDGRDVTIIENPNVGSETSGISVLANMGIVTVDGFTANNFRNGITQSWTQSAGTAFIVKNCKVIPENNSTAPYLRNGIQVSGDGSQVIDNYVVGAPLTSTWSSTAIGIVNAKNVLVQGNTVNTSAADIGIGVLNYSTTLVENITIENNYINGAKTGVSISGNNNTLNVQDVFIKDNELLNSPTGYGINVQKVTLGDFTVTGNTITGNGWAGIRFSSSSTILVGNILINENNILDNVNYGIFYGSISTVNPTLNVTKNTITGNGWAGIISYSPSAIIANENDLSNNAYYGIYNTTTHLIDAKNNWWGDSTGPLDTWSGDGSIPDTNSGSGNAVYGKVDYSKWAVNSSFTFDAPVNLGWNIRSLSPNNPGERPVDLSCGAYTNADFDIYGNGQISQNWESTTAPTNVKYQREYKSPGGSSWSTDGTAYTNNYIPFSTFGSSVGTEGSWNSRVRAWVDVDGDNSLNEAIDTFSDWSNECSVNYDRTAPTKPVITAPADNLMTNVNAITVTWTGGDDQGTSQSGINGYVIGYSFTPLGGSTIINWSSGVKSGNPKTHSGNYGHGQGTYVIYVKTIDNAGNESEKSDFLTVTYDGIAPTISVDSLLINDKTPALSGTWNDNNGQLSSIEITVDGQTHSVTINSDGTWDLADNVLSILADGKYDVQAKATDLAGNFAYDISSDELQIDSVAPRAEYTHYVDGVLFSDSIAYTNDIAKLTFDGVYTDVSPSSGLLKDSFVIFDAQTDGSFKFSQNGAKAYCGWRNSINTPLIVGGVLTGESFADCKSTLGEGEYYLAHQVYDNAIRWDIPSITQFRDVLGLHFVIDKTEPDSEITIPANNGSNTTIYSNSWDGMIFGTASDSSGLKNSGISKVELSIQRGSDSLFFDGDNWIVGTEETVRVMATGAETWSYTLPGILDDSYTITSHAVDNAGNVENSYKLTIVFDKTIPQVDLNISPSTPDGKNGWYQTQPEITLTPTDVNMGYVEYQWGSKDGSWTAYTGPFKPVNEGHHVLYYRATDLANNVSNPIGIKNILWDKTELTEGPLKVDATPDRSGGPDAKVTWEAADDNVGIDHYKVTFDLLDGDADFSEDVASHIREFETSRLTEAGTWKVTVTAYDGAGHEKSASDEIVVDKEAPAAPTLSLDGTGAGSVDLSWTKVDDADEYIILYGVNDGQYTYAARVGNVLSYTVQGLTAGNYYFVVRAEDSSGNQSANSNQVNTLELLAAPGGGNVVAEGFEEAPEVLGVDTEETSAAEDKVIKEGEVLGVTSCNSWLNNLWWILLIVQFIGLFAAEYLLGKKHKWIKWAIYLIAAGSSIAAVYYLVNKDCFDGTFTVWLLNYYYIPVLTNLMLVRIFSYLLIED